MGFTTLPGVAIPLSCTSATDRHQPVTTTKAVYIPADRWSMQMNLSTVTLLMAGVALMLYIMRRRVRLGKRQPKF